VSDILASAVVPDRTGTKIISWRGRGTILGEDFLDFGLACPRNGWKSAFRHDFLENFMRAVFKALHTGIVITGFPVRH
jgi:hypothetical protein